MWKGGGGDKRFKTIIQGDDGETEMKGNELINHVKSLFLCRKSSIVYLAHPTYIYIYTIYYFFIPFFFVKGVLYYVLFYPYLVLMIDF